MAQSLSKILIDIVFATKERYLFLNAQVRCELHAYSATVLRTCESPAVSINSVADHLHIHCQLSRRRAVCDVIEEVKKNTSRWLKTKGGILEKFYRPNRCGAFSVSQSNVDSAKDYIAQQEAHRRRTSFEDESRNLLSRHGVERDERQVWD